MSRTLPYCPVPLRIFTHHTHDTNQIHRIYPNRFGKAIRKKSAPEGFILPYRLVPLRTATYHTQVRIKFTKFSRNDSGRRFVEIRLLLDKGFGICRLSHQIQQQYTLITCYHQGVITLSAQELSL